MIAIIGAGPTGCALGTYLARAGQQVVLLDRADPPRIVVGESLLPACAPVLAELGIDMSGFLVKHGAVFTRGDQAVRFPFAEAMRPAPPFAWQTPRDVLDTRMREAAVQAGATLRIADVTDVRFDAGGATLHTSQGPLQADFVVDAGGRDQFLARKLNLRERHPWLRNAAVLGWHTGVRPQPPEQPGDIVISEFEGGWFWFIPFAGGAWSVGAVCTPEGPKGADRFEQALARCPAAQRRLEGATRLEPWRGASDISVRSTRLHGPGWALLGDAGAFLDPIFSTGLSLGLNAARGLADALIEGADPARLDRWEAWCRSSVAAFEPLVAAWYDGSFLDVALADRARQQPTVRQAIISLLAGDVFDPDFDTPRRFGHRFGSIHRIVTFTG